MEEKQLLLGAHETVVALLGLLHLRKGGGVGSLPLSTVGEANIACATGTPRTMVRCAFMSLTSGKDTPYTRCRVSLSTLPSQYEEEVLVTSNALIAPVLGTCGPRHRSIRGPHRYAVV